MKTASTNWKTSKPALTKSTSKLWKDQVKIISLFRPSGMAISLHCSVIACSASLVPIFFSFISNFFFLTFFSFFLPPFLLSSLLPYRPFFLLSFLSVLHSSFYSFFPSIYLLSLRSLSLFFLLSFLFPIHIYDLCPPCPSPQVTTFRLHL